MTRIAIDFAIAYVIAMIAISLIDEVIIMMLGRGLGSFTSIAAFIAGAHWAGSKHGMRTGVIPEPAYCWRASAVMVLTSVLLSVIVIAGLFLIFSDDVRAVLNALSDVPLWIWLAVLVVVLGIYWVAGRFMFGSAAKKAAEKAAKDLSDVF